MDLQFLAEVEVPEVRMVRNMVQLLLVRMTPFRQRIEKGFMNIKGNFNTEDEKCYIQRHNKAQHIIFIIIFLLSKLASHVICTVPWQAMSYVRTCLMGGGQL